MPAPTPTPAAAPAIEAVIFDFDGLILDTETPEFVSWQEIFQSYGATLERGVWDGFIGRGFGEFDVCGYLSELSGQPIDRDVVRPKMRAQYLRRIEENLILPGVETFIAHAKRVGMKLAVASSSRGGWASGHLERRGLLPHFEFVLSGEDVANVKPDPELYIKAARMLGADPRLSVAIEDSRHGLTAAKRAGMQCVVVPNPMTRHMRFDDADIRLNKLSDMPPDAVLAALNRNLAPEPAPEKPANPPKSAPSATQNSQSRL